MISSSTALRRALEVLSLSSVFLFTFVPNSFAGPQAVTGEIFVGYAPRTSALHSDAAGEEIAEPKRFGLIRQAAAHVSAAGHGRAISEVDAAYLQSIKEACAPLIDSGVAEYCEPNYIYRAQAVPNDPAYSDGLLYGMTKVAGPQAWDITTGSEDVVVAVVDTGVQTDHLDLMNNIQPGGYDFVEADADPADGNGHGTHVAGTIGGRGNNGIGVTGINWNVRILPVRVLDNDGAGSLYDVAQGIIYAADHGAHVINLSLGGPSGGSGLHDALAYAASKGVFIACAAGNEGADNDNEATPSYPSNFNITGLIAVAATDENDRLAYFSNYGVTHVDVAAPGVSITSTYPSQTYDVLDGTSMATPMVAGIGALVKAANPALTGSQIKDIIMNSVDSIGSLQGVIATGGRVNAYRAVVTAQSGEVPDPSPGDGGGGVSDSSLYITVKNTKKARKKANARVLGVMSDAEDNGITDTAVSLLCDGTLVAESITDEDGYFDFTVRRPAKFAAALSCVATDGAGQSNTVTISTYTRARAKRASR